MAFDWESLYKTAPKAQNEYKNYQKEFTRVPAVDDSRGLLDRVFDALQIGGYASSGALYNLTDNNPETSALEGITEGIKAGNPFGDGNEDGEKIFSDVLGNLGWNPEHLPGKVAKGAVGLAGDIFLDPLSYVNPISAVSKVVGGTGTIAKGMKLPSISLDDAIKAVKNNYSKSTMSPEALEVFFKSDAFDKEVADLQSSINNRFKMIRNTGEDFQLGGKNLPFASKIKVPGTGKHLDDFTTTLIEAKKLRAVGDKTIAPYYNGLVNRIKDTKMIKKFRHDMDIYELMKTDPVKAATNYHLINKIDGISNEAIKRDINIFQSANEFAKMFDTKERALEFLRQYDSGEIKQMMDAKGYVWKKTDLIKKTDNAKTKEKAVKQLVEETKKILQKNIDEDVLPASVDYTSEFRGMLKIVDPDYLDYLIESSEVNDSIIEVARKLNVDGYDDLEKSFDSAFKDKSTAGKSFDANDADGDVFADNIDGEGKGFDTYDEAFGNSAGQDADYIAANKAVSPEVQAVLDAKLEEIKPLFLSGGRYHKNLVEEFIKSLKTKSGEMVEQHLVKEISSVDGKKGFQTVKANIGNMIDESGLNLNRYTPESKKELIDFINKSYYNMEGVIPDNISDDIIDDLVGALESNESEISPGKILEDIFIGSKLDDKLFDYSVGVMNKKYGFNFKKQTPFYKVGEEVVRVPMFQTPLYAKRYIEAKKGKTQLLKEIAELKKDKQAIEEAGKLAKLDVEDFKSSASYKDYLNKSKKEDFVVKTKSNISVNRSLKKQKAQKDLQKLSITPDVIGYRQALKQQDEIQARINTIRDKLNAPEIKSIDADDLSSLSKLQKQQLERFKNINIELSKTSDATKRAKLIKEQDSILLIDPKVKELISTNGLIEINNKPGTIKKFKNGELEIESFTSALRKQQLANFKELANQQKLIKKFKKLGDVQKYLDTEKVIKDLDVQLKAGREDISRILTNKTKAPYNPKSVDVSNEHLKLVERWFQNKEDIKFKLDAIRNAKEYSRYRIMLEEVAKGANVKTIDDVAKLDPDVLGQYAKDVRKDAINKYNYVTGSKVDYKYGEDIDYSEHQMQRDIESFNDEKIKNQVDDLSKASFSSASYESKEKIINEQLNELYKEKYNLEKFIKENENIEELYRQNQIEQLTLEQQFDDISWSDKAAKNKAEAYFNQVLEEGNRLEQKLTAYQNAIKKLKPINSNIEAQGKMLSELESDVSSGLKQEMPNISDDIRARVHWSDVKNINVEPQSGDVTTLVNGLNTKKYNPDDKYDVARKILKNEQPEPPQHIRYRRTEGEMYDLRDPSAVKEYKGGTASQNVEVKIMNDIKESVEAFTPEPNLPMDADEFATKVAKFLDEHMTKLGWKEETRGLLEAGAVDRHRGKYIAQMRTQEAIDWVKANAPEAYDKNGGFNPQWFAAGYEKKFNKGREFKTIEEANRIMKDRTGIEKWFEDDIVKIFEARSLASNRLVYNDDMVRLVKAVAGVEFAFGQKISGHTAVVSFVDLNHDLLKKFKGSIPDSFFDGVNKGVPEDMWIKREFFSPNNAYIPVTDEQVKYIVRTIKNSDNATKPYNGLNVFQLDDMIMKRLNKESQIQKKLHTGAFLNVYDRFLSVYKSLNTVVMPGFHAQNALSNEFQMYLADGASVLDPRKLKNAAEIYANKHPDKMISLGEINLTHRQIRELAEKYGILDNTFFKKDLRKGTAEPGVLSKAGVSGKYDPTDMNEFGPYKLGGKVGSSIEGSQRLVLFIEELKRGTSMKEAVDKVNKYMFDYGDLTDFEKDTMKRIIPFYTFMRKNIPMELEEMIENPNKFRNVDKALDEIEGMSGEERVPDSQRNQWRKDHVQMPFKLGGQNFGINPQLPYQQLDRLTPRKILGQTTPAIRSPIEILTGKYAYNGMDIGGPVEYLASQLAPTKMINQQADKEGIKKHLYIMSQLGGFPMGTL